MCFDIAKFDRYVAVPKRESFLAKLISEVEMIEIKEAISICRDSKDDKFLELTINGKANYLITGDKDLLVLHPFRKIIILNPTEFLQNL